MKDYKTYHEKYVDFCLRSKDIDDALEWVMYEDDDAIKIEISGKMGSMDTRVSAPIMCEMLRAMQDNFCAMASMYKVRMTKGMNRKQEQ
jgi:hypothetical protein